MSRWNPWHGCRRISSGCLHCYVYSIDESHDIDASEVRKTSSFELPLKRGQDGKYKLMPEDGTVLTCLSSDFFLAEADGWRDDAWAMIRERKDLNFCIITKRITRFDECVPDDWGDGYGNVTICCTVENNDAAALRLPVFAKAVIKHKEIICEPLLENIDLSRYLTPEIERVSVGGESGDGARLCDYSWISAIREQCISAGVPFRFRQTGACFLKDGVIYRIHRKYQRLQAEKADIDFG